MLSKSYLFGMLNLIRRDILLLKNEQTTWVNLFIFALLIALVFPFALPNNDKLLMQIGPGVYWLACFTTIITSVETIFRNDYEDGSWDLWLTSPLDNTLIVLTRLFSHWLSTLLPLFLLAPLIALTYHLDWRLLSMLWLALIFASWVMVAFGAIGVALTLSLKKAGLLLGIIVLPFYVPGIILCNLLSYAGAMGQPIFPYICLLLALSLIALVLAPVFCLSGIRLSAS